jgi:hypothetical protein
MNQALLSKQAAERDTPFPYGMVQAELPESSPAAVALASVREEIAEEDLAGRGRDIGPPHITLRYGIQGEDTSWVGLNPDTPGTKRPLSLIPIRRTIRSFP